MQKIHHEQNVAILNKDKISMTDFSLCIVFQHGSARGWGNLLHLTSPNDLGTLHDHIRLQSSQEAANYIFNVPHASYLNIRKLRANLVWPEPLLD